MYDDLKGAFGARSHVVLIRADAKNMLPRRRALNQAQRSACLNAAGRPCCSQACAETGAAGCAPHSRPVSLLRRALRVGAPPHAVDVVGRPPTIAFPANPSPQRVVPRLTSHHHFAERALAALLACSSNCCCSSIFGSGKHA